MNSLIKLELLAVTLSLYLFKRSIPILILSFPLDAGFILKPSLYISSIDLGSAESAKIGRRRSSPKLCKRLAISWLVSPRSNISSLNIKESSCSYTSIKAVGSLV